MANWTTATLYKRAEEFVADYNQEHPGDMLYGESTLADFFTAMERDIVAEQTGKKGTKIKGGPKELRGEPVVPEIPGQVSVDDALAEELGLS